MTDNAPAPAATQIRTPRPGPTALRVIALVIPVVGLVLLLVQPEWDAAWQHQPAHFWLVLAAGAINAVLAYATSVAASRRGDARVLLVSLAFLAAAGFLGLHALATPGVLLTTPNAGFVLATPVGLLVAACFAAASSAELPSERAAGVMRHASAMRWALIGGMALWAVVSLAGLPPLDQPGTPERASGVLVALAAVGVALYAVAVWRYLALYRRRGSQLLLAMATAFVLLGEAEAAVAFGRNWHLSWWEWHLLMLAAFVIIAVSAQHQWHEERFSALYTEQTSAGTRELSVLFADLAGFTSFSERHEPAQVAAMLNEYFEKAIPPVVERHGGEVDRLIGDALMAVFLPRDGMPDHPVRAARAALDIQRATATIADQHPDWPRFRVGVNSGEAVVGVLGARGGRTYTVIGDTVNLASRLEGTAPVGGVAVSAETARRIPDVQVEPLGQVSLKGKAEPVAVFRLVGFEE